MNSVWKAAINGRGTVLALASGDEGTDDSATHALVMVRNGATSVLAVVGESINTDMGPVTLSAIFNPSLNAQDQCTMTARIRPLRPGPDVDALFAWDPESGWHLLARDGTPARRTNSAMASLTNVMWFLSFPISGGEDDRATFLSNSGRVVFEAASEDLSYYVLTTQIPSFGAGDTNGDGRVDSADLSVVLSQFGNTVPPGAPGDLNADAVVNAADLSVLLSLIPT
jgi:hypothetical protein